MKERITQLTRKLGISFCFFQKLLKLGVFPLYYTSTLTVIAILNPFHATGLFLNPQIKQHNSLMFSEKYRKRPVVRNRLSNEFEPIMSLFFRDYYPCSTMCVLNCWWCGSSSSFWQFLTHFSAVSHFYTPWKRHKTIGFLVFSGGVEIRHWTKMG